MFVAYVLFVVCERIAVPYGVGTDCGLAVWLSMRFAVWTCSVYTRMAAACMYRCAEQLAALVALVVGATCAEKGVSGLGLKLGVGRGGGLLAG